MAVLKAWGLVLLSLSCAAGCTWMKTQNRASLSSFQVLSNSSISHLEQACTHSAQPTATAELSVEFPHKHYNRMFQLQAQDHILFILRTLKSIMKLYSGKYEKVDCNQHQLQIFLLDMHRQILELERCAENIVASEAQKKVSKKIEMHFRSLVSHLKTMDYSPQGWDEIAEVVLKHLRRLDLLASKTKIDLQD